MFHHIIFLHHELAISFSLYFFIAMIAQMTLMICTGINRIKPKPNVKTAMMTTMI